ncbi:MAG: polymerase subunit delta [Chthoniobacter sp.]|jgi:DNA polymerase-3 subunit delta|nr:polymerase subunit delta [Chthoniobacter sp.]
MAAAKKTKTTGSAIFTIAGSDDTEVKRAAALLAEELAPMSAGDFGRDVIDGCADNADQAVTRIHQTIEALLTLPFFGGEKLVWLKSANFLADSVTGRAASVVEALERLEQTLAAGLPDGVKFLLSAVEVDKRRTFYKSLGKLGKVQLFDKVDASRSGWEEEAAGAVESRALGLGLRLSGEALELFTLLTGGDTRQIENELGKIDLYLGTVRRDVRASDVRLLVPLSRAGVIFELGNALARRDVRRGLALAEQLLKQGESAVGILLVAIAPTVRHLLIARDLMHRHKLRPPQAPFHFTAALNRLAESALEHLPRKKDGSVNSYALGLAAMQAHRFSAAELRGLLGACLRANLQLVTTQLDPSVVLSRLVILFSERRDQE